MSVKGVESTMMPSLLRSGDSPTRPGMSGYIIDARTSNGSRLSQTPLVGPIRAKIYSVAMAKLSGYMPTSGDASYIVVCII